MLSFVFKPHVHIKTWTSHKINDQSKEFFDEVLKGLDQLNINYVINDRLVRGLDYYTHTAFEFTSPTSKSDFSAL